MIDKNFDVSKLYNLRIHELRDVARELGVKSPTSLTKQKIMEEINLIVSGEKDPYFNVRKQGRPVKTDELDISEFVSATDDGASQLLKPWKVESINQSYILKCNEFEFTKSLPTDRVVRGYVDIHPEGYGLVRKKGFIPSPMDTFIPTQLVIKYNLVSGMYIVGVERFVAADKPYALIAIESREVLDYNYDLLPGENLGKKIYTYLNIDVFSGGRYFIKNENTKDLFINAYTIAQSVAKTNDDVISKVIYVKSLPERLPHKSEGVEELNIPFDTFDKDIVNAVGLFLAKSKLEACDKKVVVVIAGLTEVAKAYNNALNGENSAKINEFTSTKVNSLLACAKSIREGNAGITLICLDNYKISEEMQRMFEYDILDNFSN